MPKHGKFTFTLTNIDTVNIHKLYSLKIDKLEKATNAAETDTNKTTRLADLNKDNKAFVSFLDETKNSHVCNLSMVDINNINLKTTSNIYNCYWCKHSFDSYAIGCPIRYVPKQCVKTYYSNISKDDYKIKEDITYKKYKQLENEDNYSLKNSYYETDGVFCSFNCCKAYIKENRHQKIYNTSMTLLNKMYFDITDQYCKNIIEAPSWRNLKEYGGHLDIEDFRNGFNKIAYTHQGTVKDIDIKPVINLYEEKILF